MPKCEHFVATLACTLFLSDGHRRDDAGGVTGVNTGKFHVFHHGRDVNVFAVREGVSFAYGDRSAYAPLSPSTTRYDESPTAHRRALWRKRSMSREQRSTQAQAECVCESEACKAERSCEWRSGVTPTALATYSRSMFSS